jgi:hypothetical protein
MIPLTGKPLTTLGASLEKSPAIQLTAKAFLVGFAFEVAKYSPMLSDPASIIVSLTNPTFDLTFFNGALGNALVAAWTITMSNPLELKVSAPSNIIDQSMISKMSPPSDDHQRPAL